MPLQEFKYGLHSFYSLLALLTLTNADNLKHLYPLENPLAWRQGVGCHLIPDSFSAIERPFIERLGDVLSRSEGCVAGDGEHAWNAESLDVMEKAIVSHHVFLHRLH